MKITMGSCRYIIVHTYGSSNSKISYVSRCITLLPDVIRFQSKRCLVRVSRAMTCISVTIAESRNPCTKNR